MRSELRIEIEGKERSSSIHAYRQATSKTGQAVSHPETQKTGFAPGSTSINILILPPTDLEYCITERRTTHHHS